jgi:hypothetical protein
MGTLLARMSFWQVWTSGLLAKMGYRSAQLSHLRLQRYSSALDRPLPIGMISHLAIGGLLRLAVTPILDPLFRRAGNGCRASGTINSPSRFIQGSSSWVTSAPDDGPVLYWTYEDTSGEHHDGDLVDLSMLTRTTGLDCTQWLIDEALRVLQRTVARA